MSALLYVLGGFLLILIVVALAAWPDDSQSLGRRYQQVEMRRQSDRAAWQTARRIQDRYLAAYREAVEHTFRQSTDQQRRWPQ